jgi:hypothetical protein
MTETITLKAYLQHRGFQLKRVAQMVGMEYEAFWQFLAKDSTLTEDVARRIEILTQHAWIAEKVGNRFRMKIRMEA